MVLVGEDDDDVAGVRVDIDLAFIAGGATVVADEGDAAELLVGEPVGVFVNRGSAGLG